MTTFRRVPARLLLLALTLGLAALLPRPGHAQELRPAPTITIVQVSGAFDSAYAGFLRGELARADRRGDVAVLIRLNSSGTVKADGRALAAAVANTKVPVATWVGPTGAHVRGAATLVWLAGDVRLVSSGARVGSPARLAIGGRTELPVEAPAALVEPGTTLRANALLEQRIATGSAGTLVEAVRALDGQTVDGRVLHLDPALTVIRFARPGPVVAVRHSLASNPTLVYLLLLTGIGAIVFEAFQPGFGPAGYAGALLVALAAYGLVSMPVSPLGAALLLAGVGGMALDVRRNALGAFTWAGAAVLTAGSVLLVHSHGPALRPAVWAIAVGVLGSLVFYGVVMTVVLRALRGQAGQITEALVGRSGEVRSTLNPQGHVLVEGALWRARAVGWEGPVAAGTPVRITGIDAEALVLDVEPLTAKG
ncbi:MAG TPA: NfeD family protein [Mycobacteriales bacterium]|nr:NfeD family protein [Mycobacteriales bacterium]